MTMQSETITVLGKSGEFDDEDVIYLTLDSLLDTRLGTLAKIDSDLAVKALNGSYRNRIIDDFDGISREDFKKAYAQRDLTTLKHSMVTNVSFLLRKIIKDSLAIAVQQQKVTNINIELNIWPYVMDSEEEIDMLIACVLHHAYNSARVRVISAHPKLLTPRYVEKNYQLMINYDWLEWLEYHKADFEKMGIPSVAVIAPQLFHDRIPEKEEIIEISKGGNNVFVMTEKMFAALFRLNLLPASLFSIIEEVNKDTIADKLTIIGAGADAIETAIKKVQPQAHVERVLAEGPNLNMAEVEQEVAKEEEESGDDYNLL